MRIALLGWGSLLSDSDTRFAATHGEWQPDGPRLPLEFTRISASHQSALTLVIDKRHGTSCTVAWCESTLGSAEEAVAALLKWEEIKSPGVHHLLAATALPPTASSILVTIATWARAKQLDAVVWNGLESNFTKATGKQFSVSTAVAHLKQLPPRGLAMAQQYVMRAPGFVRTPLRTALEGAPWFRAP
jgi:hypothetical protein